MFWYVTNGIPKMVSFQRSWPFGTSVTQLQWSDNWLQASCKLFWSLKLIWLAHNYHWNWMPLDIMNKSTTLLDSCRLRKGFGNRTAGRWRGCNYRCRCISLFEFDLAQNVEPHKSHCLWMLHGVPCLLYHWNTVARATLLKPGSYILQVEILVS